MWGWRKTAKQRPELRLELYTRAGCHLCDTAHEQLLRWRKEHGFTLNLVDIEKDAALVEAYGNCVPVVTVNGKVRFRGHVNPVLFKRLMDGA